MKKNRILVIQTAFLGDIVLATAFLADLRKKFPDTSISFLTTPIGKQILEKSTMGIEIISFDKRGRDKGLLGFWRMRTRLKKMEIDFVFCLHRSVRSVLLATMIQAKSYGFREAACSFLFTKRTVRKFGDHEVEKNFSLLRLVDERKLDKPSGPALVSPTAEKIFTNSYVAVCPGSVWQTKMWPKEYYAELIKRILELGFSVVLLGQNVSEETIIGSEIEIQIEPIHKHMFKNLIGKTTLPELLAIIQNSSIVVTNDSSPLHIATALQRKVLAIFGPTTKELGFFPFSSPNMHRVAEIYGLECRPCGAHGHSRCPLSHFQCMKNLTVEMVWQKFMELVSAGSK